jgi:hypothetical protein
MKAILIAINWTLSLAGLSIDTERSPMWACMLMIGWFCASTALLKWADRKGVFDEFTK